MSLSADALNFVLALDDRLTPALGKTARNYAKFTRDIDRQNGRAVKSVNRAFAAMSDLAKSFDALPKKAVESYRQAAQAVQRIAKPVRMRVVLDVAGKKFEQDLARAVTAAVRRALSSATMAVQLGAARGGRVVRAPVTSTLPQSAPLPPEPARAPRPPRDLFVPNNPRGLMTTDQRITMMNAFGRKMGSARAQVGKPGAGAARNSLLEAYAALPAFERKKVNADFQAMMRDLRSGTQGAAAAMGSIGGVADRIKGGFGAAADSIKSISRDTRFMAVMTVLDHLGGVLGKGQQFNQGMNELNKGMHLSRKELDLMASATSEIADQTKGILSSTDVQGAMTSLAQVGVRSQKEFADMAPAVAMAAKAMNIDTDTAAQAAHTLGMQYKFTKDQVTSTFADLSKIEEKTGMTGGASAQAMLSNAKLMGNFPGELSSEERQKTFGNMARLQGALFKNLGPEAAQNIMQMLSSAVGNASGPEALNAARLTGLTGGDRGGLAQALRTGDVGSIVEGIRRSTAAGDGNSTVMAQLGQMMGVDPNTLMGFQQNGDGIMDDLKGMQGELKKTGSAWQSLMDDANVSMTESAKTINKFWDTVNTSIPQWAKDIWADSGVKIGAGGVIGAGLWGLGKKALGMFGVGGAKAAAGGVGAALEGAAGSGAGVAGRGLAARFGLGALGAAGGAASLLLGTSASLGDSRDDTGNGASAAMPGTGVKGPQTTYERLFAAAHPVYSSLFGTAYENGSVITDVDALQRQAAMIDERTASQSRGPSDPRLMMMSQMTDAADARRASAARVAANPAAADALQSIQDAIQGAMGFSAAPANGPSSVPPRDRPGDPVLRSFSQYQQ